MTGSCDGTRLSAVCSFLTVQIDGRSTRCLLGLRRDLWHLHFVVDGWGYLLLFTKCHIFLLSGDSRIAADFLQEIQRSFSLIGSNSVLLLICQWGPGGMKILGNAPFKTSGTGLGR